MPKGANRNNVKSESLKYTHNLNDYPYQAYMSWAPHDQGNILFNDKKFLELVYQHNNAVFYDYKKVVDASVSTKKSIYNFLEENEDTIVIVDCENSDPYKLCSMIISLNEEELQKIKKIVLFNDSHTATAWQILNQFFKIPIEHHLVERVKEHKSLVDIKVTAETCREHYQNNINSFILCSSDSDYWGLITSLDKVNFLIMIENSKWSSNTQNALDNAGIVYCSMDDFTSGNINKIKIKALTTQIEKYIEERVNLNVNEMLDTVYERTRIQMAQGERKQFYDNYIKTMKLNIASDGKVSIQLKD